MKLNKIKMVVPPLSEMEDAQLEDILAGWICFSFAPTQTCLTEACTVFRDKLTCGDSDTNFCEVYFLNGVCVGTYE